jgi:hypothetical protein
MNKIVRSGQNLAPTFVHDFPQPGALPIVVDGEVIGSMGVSSDLPVGISFLGPAFGEQRLLSLGFSFEHATRARRRPVHTPALEGASISVPQ